MSMTVSKSWRKPALCRTMGWSISWWAMGIFPISKMAFPISKIVFPVCGKVG